MVKRSGNHWTFQLIRPQARQVFLVGDFNGWSCAATPMSRNSAGLWEQTLLLPPGVYRFRYYADGQWLTDFAAYGVQRNPLGDFDSVLLVEDVARAADVPPTPRPQRRTRFRSSGVAIDVPSAASRRHVALAAARQRRLVSASPVGIEHVVETASPSEQLAEV